MFQFLFVSKGCIFNNSLKTTSKNDLAIRLGINKKPLGFCLLGDRLGVWFHLKD